MVWEDLATATWEEKKKAIHREDEVKFSLFADSMILYRENSKDATRKLLEGINEYSKVRGCKINKLKSLAFLYCNNGRYMYPNVHCSTVCNS